MTEPASHKAPVRNDQDDRKHRLRSQRRHELVSQQRTIAVANCGPNALPALRATGSDGTKEYSRSERKERALQKQLGRFTTRGGATAELQSRIRKSDLLL